MTPEQRLQWIHESRDQDDLRQRYDEWASEYEDHLVGGLAYQAPDVGVSLLKTRVPVSARILDIGAGTGLVGQRLHTAGYRDLVALDYSAGMLEQARAKEVYALLSRQDLLAPLSFPSASFDAAIAIGVFNDDHVSAGAFDEVLRVVRRGGVFLFSVLTRFYEQRSFREAVQRLEQGGQWRLVEQVGPFAARKSVEGEGAGAAMVLAYEVGG